MSRKDVIIAGYMMNEKHVIAEMLYDTITRYENMLSNMAAIAEADKAVMDAYKKKWKEEGILSDSRIDLSMIKAQESALSKIWGGAENDVWDDIYKELNAKL